MLQLDFTQFPELFTERMHLKRVTSDQLHDLLEMRSDPVAMKFIGKPLARTTEDAMEFLGKMETMINANEGIAWGIFFKETTELVGTISYHKIDKIHSRAEVGYMLKPRYFKKKIMSEVLPTIINYGLNNLNFHSIEAIINPDNEASAGLLVKNHFIKEAHFKENFYFDGKFYDSAVYSLLNKK